MTIAQRKLLIAVLALFMSAGVAATDAPKAEPPKDAKDEKKDAKADAPAEPDLPSKPYPKNATPKAFLPKGETSPKADAGNKPAEKSTDKPAEKVAEKPAAKPGQEKPAEKQAADKPAPKQATDKHAADKPADAPVVNAPKQESAPRKFVKKHPSSHHANAKPAVQPNPAMQELAREASAKHHGANNRESYVVQARDNLDSVIRKTMPSNPFSVDVLRQAYLRANPSLLAAANVKLRPGQVLQVPDVATVRAVINGEEGKAHSHDHKPNLHTQAPVVAPTVAATANDLNPPIAIPRLPVDVVSSHNPAPEVSPEEKKKWVRYP